MTVVYTVVATVVADVEVTVVGADVVTVVTDVCVKTDVTVTGGSAGGGGRSGGKPTPARAGAALRVSMARAVPKSNARMPTARNTAATVETCRRAVVMFSLRGTPANSPRSAGLRCRIGAALDAFAS